MPLAVQAEHPAEVAFALKAPEVKEGVILESQLSVAAYAAGDEKAAAGHVKKVWIFPPDPFADRSQWLKGLKITLFDPERKTADVLEKAGVPFMFTKNPSALDELNEGLLVIGEGISWRDYRGLGESMVRRLPGACRSYAWHPAKAPWCCRAAKGPNCPGLSV